jgi:hypothetical protein
MLEVAGSEAVSAVLPMRGGVNLDQGTYWNTEGANDAV